MIIVCHIWRAWWVSRVVRRRRRGAAPAWFMRVLASGLMLNTTFPLDVLAQATPAAVAQPATGQQIGRAHV